MIKHLPLLLLIGLALNINNDLVAQDKLITKSEDDPCLDEEYLELKSVIPYKLSKDDYERYIELRANCNRSINYRKAPQKPKKTRPSKNLEKYGITEEKNKQRVSRTSYKVTPCNDKKYLELKRKNLDDLTDREFQYLMFKEKNCEEWRNNNYKSNKIVEKPSYRKKRNSPNKETSNALGQLGNELLNLLNESTKVPEFSTNKNKWDVVFSSYAGGGISGEFTYTRTLFEE